MFPRIILEGDTDAARRLIPTAKNQLYRVREMAAASGARVTGHSFAPNPDSFIYALKVGETEVLHIFVQPQEVEELLPREFAELPDFLNGATTIGRLVEREVMTPDGLKVVTLMRRFKPTPETAQKYDWDELRWRELGRLTVKPWSSFGLPDPVQTSTQYELVTGSMYSGRMRKLVQIVLGYGKLPSRQISEEGPERSAMLREGIQVRYDYRWHRTHNLYLGPDGAQWLIEISINNGVLAMQLPMYPNSRSIRHSRYPSMRACFQEFGGLPTGVAFPAGAALQRRIQNGTILRLIEPQDMAAFYELQSYSSAMGWTFNEAGAEAHNTGWRWGSNGVRLGAHYVINIKIGPLLKEREPNDPIAIGTAKLTLVSEDHFYDPSDALPPAIKFHEPLLGGLMSVEMTALGRRDVPVDELPGMDATLHVMWVKNALATVRYFWNRAEQLPPAPVETDEEECMYLGSWLRREQAEPTTGSFRFYTTFEDDRVSFYATETERRTTGQDLGWHGGPRVADHPDDPFVATITRIRAFRKRTRLTQYFSRSGFNCVVVPGGSRDAHAYYQVMGNAGSFTTEDIFYEYLQDPYVYFTIRRLYLNFETGQCPGRYCVHGVGGGGCQCCAQRELRLVSVKLIADEANASQEQQAQCNWEYANEGPWLDYCDPVALSLNAPVFTPYSLPAVVGPPVYKAKALLYTDTEYGALKINDDPDHRLLWRDKSPNDQGVIQSMVCTYNCFGDDHIAYGDMLNVGVNQRKGWILDQEDQSEQSVNFLGVVWRQLPAS